MLAAVGLLSLSSESFDAVDFRTGGGGTSEPRDRASDAAVGANSPVDGVTLGGRGDVVAEGVLGRDADGVFGRDTDADAEGVFGRDGVTDAREGGLDRDGVDFTADEMDAVELERAGWNDDGGDFAGVRVGAPGFALAVLGLLLDGVVGGRVVDGRAAAGLEAGTAFFGDGGVGETTLSDVTGETEVCSGAFSAAGGAGAGSGAAAGISGAGFGSGSGSGSDAGAGGSGDLIKLSSFDSNALATIGARGFGGHSRRSLSSSFAASPVCCDATLDERGGTADAAFCCFLFCCSNRPMRLATLWRGRSSGSGLQRGSRVNHDSDHGGAIKTRTEGVHWRPRWLVLCTHAQKALKGRSPSPARAMVMRGMSK